MLGSAFNHAERQSLQAYIETPHHRNALGKLGRGGEHNSGSSGNSISLHTEQEVPGIKRRSEEEGGKTIRSVKERLRKKQTTEERGHSFLFPFLW